MNEPRFIELLNLYVDQQLSAQEAAELESEIKLSPTRRRTYQQYCRMQKACTQLFENERSAAPASTALARAMAEADRKVVTFPEQAVRRPVWATGFSFAAVAAAACVAFVVVRQTDRQSKMANEGAPVATTANTPAVSSPIIPTAAIAATITTAQPTAEVTEEFKPIFTTPALRSKGKAEEFFVAGASVNASTLEWTQHVQFKPVRKVSSEDFVFGTQDNRATDKTINARFNANGSEEPAEEMTVLMFQK